MGRLPAEPAQVAKFSTLGKGAPRHPHVGGVRQIHIDCSCKRFKCCAAGLLGFYRGLRAKIVQSVLAAAILFYVREEIYAAVRLIFAGLGMHIMQIWIVVHLPSPSPPMHACLWICLARSRFLHDTTSFLSAGQRSAAVAAGDQTAQGASVGLGDSTDSRHPPNRNLAAPACNWSIKSATCRCLECSATASLCLAAAASGAVLYF